MRPAWHVRMSHRLSSPVLPVLSHVEGSEVEVRSGGGCVCKACDGGPRRHLGVARLVLSWTEGVCRGVARRRTSQVRRGDRPSPPAGGQQRQSHRSMQQIVGEIWRLIVAVTLVCGCAKPIATGSFREVRLLCDDREWGRVARFLREAVETPIETVEPETVFAMVRVGAGAFQTERFSANLMLVAALDSPDSVGQLLRKLLPEDSQAAVRRSESFLFAESDLWAADQHVAILTGPDLETLVAFVRRAGTFLFSTLYAPLAKRAVDRAYYRGGNESLRQELVEKYGWSLLLPTPWHTEAVDGEDLVYFYKNDPDRHVMVYWAPAKMVTLSPDSCLALRRQLVWRHYDEDQVDQDRTHVDETTFLGMPALKIVGVWQNEKHVMGGPFRTYCFVCPDEDRFYLLDLNVFAPGREKFPFLAQLEGIAASFTCGGQKAPDTG